MKSFKELILREIPKGGDAPKPRQNICILNMY